MVFKRLRAIAKIEPGIPFKTLKEKYTELYGPIEAEAFGFPSLNSLVKHAGLESVGDRARRGFYITGGGFPVGVETQASGGFPMARSDQDLVMSRFGDGLIRSSLNLVCTRLRAILASEPLPIGRLKEKYILLHGPIESESFGFSTLNSLMKHAGLRQFDDGATRGLWLTLDLHDRPAAPAKRPAQDDAPTKRQR